MNFVVRPLTGEGIFPLIPGMDKELISAMNEWRARQDPPIEANDAILALLRLALESEGILAKSETPKLDPAVQALIAEFRSLNAARRA